MTQPLVHILINNWNGREDTIACLESLYRIDYQRFVVILVDNGSTDGTPDAVEAWCSGTGIPVVRRQYAKGTPYSAFAAEWYGDAKTPRSLMLIECDASIGFTGANNLSIELALLAGADYVLFLNNDTEVSPDFLSRLVASAQSHEPAVWGCKITFFDPADQVWFAGGYVNFWGVAVADGAGMPARLFSGIRRTELVSGCVMLLPRAVLERVGGQDDRYFFAVDDIEYSVRIGKAGFALMMNLDVVVRHKVSKSVVKKRPLQLYYLTRNTLMWRAGHYGMLRNIPFLLWWIPRWSAEVVARALVGRGAVSRGMLLGLLDFALHRTGECPRPELNPALRQR